MATIKMTFDGKSVNETKFDDALKGAILALAIGKIRTEALEALTHKRRS